MKKTKYALVSAMLSFCLAAAISSTSSAKGKDPLEHTVNQLKGMIAEKPAVPEKLFAQDFLAQVPADKVVFICKQFFEEGGAVISVKQVKSTGDYSAEYVFNTQKGMQFPVRLGLKSTKPHSIISLWFGKMHPSMKSIQDVIPQLKAMDGTTAISLWELDSEAEPKHLLNHNADIPLAIGSTFKIYILGALLDEIAAGKLTWRHTGRVRPHRKSWPSGVLHNWPDNAPLTLQTLASQMISISDNTATDILLFILGRRRVERQMEVMGNEHASLSRPFLSTREMDILKTKPHEKTHRAKYLSLGEEGRRQYLAKEIAAVKRDDLKGIEIEGVTEIDTMEWFASTADLCRTMDWLRIHTQRGDTAVAREIMNINKGLNFEDEKWKLVAFKGGSELGVMNLTWLLERADGKWFALSASINNKEKEVDASRFTAAIQGLITFLGDPI